MRDVTKLMVNKYKLRQLGYDFMGYRFKDEHELSFHHLIVPRRLCKKRNIPEAGYVEWNGAILRQNTAHNYLHLIERYDMDMYFAITSEMIDENIKGYIDIRNISHIDDILDRFEKEYYGVAPIKGEYTRRLLKRR